MENEHPRFVDRVLRLLERSEYRRADRLSDKQAIYRLRHEAYMRAGTVEARPSGMFHDPLDETDNAWLIGLYYRRRTGKRFAPARLGKSESADAQP